jgi:ketosteroid isomerase-like protein
MASGHEDDAPMEPLEPEGGASPKDAEEVVLANERFYRALEALEIERMDDAWLHADWVSCVHPGWPMLTGWKAIRESWERIFKNTETIRFELANVGVRIESATAWVTCRESILHLSTSGVSGAAADCTNIYLRTPEGWKMVLHHASAVPEPPSGAES